MRPPELGDAWALRTMQLVTRTAPAPTSALGALVSHLRALEAQPTALAA